jgi:large subunit ribosomal protein L3
MFAKIGQTPKRIMKELRCDAEFSAKFEPGQTIRLDEVFTVGQLVDAQGVTKGRGFTGVMRRWNFAGNVQTHGTHEYRRHGGSIGTNMTPGRTLPNIKMGGHYGDETVSVLNIRLVRIDADKNLLMLQGGIPGARNGLVTVRHAVKKKLGKGGKPRA